MNEMTKMAELAQPANYAGMNYVGICNYVKAQIELETRMEGMTHSYVNAMREIAKDEDIVFCFMKEMLLHPSPYASKTPSVDDQAPNNDEVKSIDAPLEKPSRMTEKRLVEFAIETVKGLPVPEGTNSKFSYYASYVFKRNNGGLILDKSCGWNMGIGALEKLKIGERARMEEHYKNVKTVVVGDYHVYLISGGKCQVSHFNMTDGVDPYVIDYTSIPKECKEEVEEATSWATLKESTSEESVCESEDNEEVTGALWEEPASEDSVSIPAKAEDSEEQRLIEKAVEMARSRGVGMMTDGNAPYFVQDEFKVTDMGDLQRTVKPFSRNIRIDEFDSFKESHLRRAQTYNASHITCADDYTAYILDGGKTICVYYYNTRGLADAAEKW